MIKLVTFYDEMTESVEEGRTMDIVYPDLSKAFRTSSHKILIEKLLSWTGRHEVD